MQYCPKCGKRSVIFRPYTTKQGQRRAVSICTTKGCGNRTHAETLK